MSDRRFVVVLMALLGAFVAALVGVLALLELRDPVSATGEIGTLVDLTPQLVLLASLCALTVIAGVTAAVVLVRSSMPGPPR